MRRGPFFVESDLLDAMAVGAQSSLVFGPAKKRFDVARRACYGAGWSTLCILRQDGTDAKNWFTSERRRETARVGISLPRPDAGANELTSIFVAQSAQLFSS